MMRHVFTGWALVALLLPATAQDAPKKEPETSAAEKIAQALREKRNLEIRNQPLNKVCDTLTGLLGVPVEVDPALAAFWAVGGSPLSVSMRCNKAPLSAALCRTLQPWGMTHVILGDKLLLTTTDRALAFQMTQKVYGSTKDFPLNKALDDLSHRFAVSITIDPAAAKEAEKPVSMQMNGTSLETTVTILAANAGLHAVRVDNALFVTTPDKAKALPREVMTMPAPPVAPLGGLLGAIGALGVGGGMIGFAGGAGAGGQVGMAGALGAFGMGGALGGGVGGQPPPRPAPKKDNSGKMSWSLPSRYPLLYLVKAAPVPGKDKPDAVSAAQKTRKELDAAVTAEFANLPLPQAISQLKEKTGVDLVLDRAVLDQYFQERNPNGTGMEGVMVTAKLNKVSLRRGLRTILTEYDLGFAVLGEQVLITTQAMASVRQMRQVIAVDVDKTPAADALKKLAREAAVNLVLDSRAAKEGQEKVSLQLDEVALDTAVKLLAEQAGLKVVIMDNVLFVTTKARAVEMRDDPDFKPRDPIEGGKFVVPGMGPGAPPMVVPAVPGGAPPAK